MKPARTQLTQVIAALAAVTAFALAPTGASAASLKKLKSTFDNGILTVKGTAKSDRILVRCDKTANVRINGRLRKSGALACANVNEVDVLAGDGNDNINMRGVDSRFGQTNFDGFGKGTGIAVAGEEGNDVFRGSASAFNIFIGLKGADRATGGDRHDEFVGGGGKDRLSGGGGRDTLFGNQDDDILIGGPGPDTLDGGKGKNVLRGGPGKDKIVPDRPAKTKTP